MTVKGVICFRGGFALVLWNLQSFYFNRSPVSSEKSERRVDEACGELLHFFFFLLGGMEWPQVQTPG